MARGLLHSGIVRLRESGRRGRHGIILTYHRINDDDDPFFPSLDVPSFEAQLDYVGDTYRVETVAGLLGWLRDGPDGPPRVALTIDDGYQDTLEVAFPRLQARRLPATLFLATAPPESGQPLWLDRLRSLLKHTAVERLELSRHGLGPRPLTTTRERLTVLEGTAQRLKRAGRAEVDDVVGELWDRLDGDSAVLPRSLSWEDVRRLAAGGIEIGGHTHRHYILSRLTREEARQEIATCLDLIRRHVGAPAGGFAFPNGARADYGAETLDLLEELGVPWACTTRSGFVTRASAPRELPRLYTAMDGLPQFACRLAGLTRMPTERAAPLGG